MLKLKMRTVVWGLILLFSVSARAQLNVKNSNNQTVMRITSTGKMAIGQNLTVDPGQTLQLANGTLEITANAGEGRVLMSNNDGVATWTASGGDVSGSYSDLTVDEIQGKTVAMPSSITSGHVLKWDGSAWAPEADADTKPSDLSRVG